MVEHKTGWELGAQRRLWNRRIADATIGIAALAVTIASAIGIKEWRHQGIPLPMVETVANAAPNARHATIVHTAGPAYESLTSQIDRTASANPSPVRVVAAPPTGHGASPSHRWFNGRPVRPARTMTMVVTAYSPDARSCGKFADGMTATLHSVTTNGGKLVAADPRVLPYGSMITVPGYDSGAIVPVLDCGSAIKGRRLDLLFPTHEQARKWGRKTLTVTIWEYADGLPPDNPRRLR